MAGSATPPYTWHMPDREHLRRLSNVWIRNPIYYVTACAAKRRRILVTPEAAAILTESWQAARNKHGWAVGRYVIMPDHVHFFAQPEHDAKTLSSFMRDWKKWTTRAVATASNVEPPVWQAEFFDHVLRTPGSYDEKWACVRENPVRAGLVGQAADWPFAGESELLDF